MSGPEAAWHAVLERVARAARAAGRDPAEVAVIAVSKTFGADAVLEVYHAGARAFGENYVQEAIAKASAVGELPGLEWHLIGPLQSNKTAIVAAQFAWVHTIDRVKIAQRLSAARAESSPPLELCIQVNISGEATKSGVAPGEAVALAHAIARLPRVRLRGFMGIAEPTEDVARQRAQFALARECLAAAKREGLALDTLSMGMSGDLEAAIAEGATLVRIGTAIFGARVHAAEASSGAHA